MTCQDSSPPQSSTKMISNEAPCGARTPTSRRCNSRSVPSDRYTGTTTEIVGAGPSHTFDILGIKMFDSCEIRVHPTGSAIVRIGVQTQGQGHETTFAQIVAEELGLPVENITVALG